MSTDTLQIDVRRDDDAPLSASPNGAPAAANHDRRGRFTARNGAALQHGLHAQHQLPAGLDHLRTEAADFLSQAIADDGDVTTLSRRRRSLLEYRALIHQKILLLSGTLDSRGIVDPRGRLRDRWLSQFTSLVSTARGLDSLLGLDRRPRQLPSLADLLTQPTATDVSTTVSSSPDPESVR
jgi:hypothetical protein